MSLPWRKTVSWKTVPRRKLKFWTPSLVQCSPPTAQMTSTIKISGLSIKYPHIGSLSVYRRGGEITTGAQPAQSCGTRWTTPKAAQATGTNHRRFSSGHLPEVPGHRWGSPGLEEGECLPHLQEGRAIQPCQLQTCLPHLYLQQASGTHCN